MAQYLRLYPWTLKHPAVATLTDRARLVYIELLMDTVAWPDKLNDKWLQKFVRKDHRETLTAAGLIVDNGDGTYAVIQPSHLYADLRTPQAVAHA